MLLKTGTFKRAMGVVTFSVVSLIGAVTAMANPLEQGWVLQTEFSSLNFQSIKNLTKVESSKFGRLNGAILPDGHAEIEIDLDSVDTKVDLRNVRMRFFLFETFIYPTAKISAQLNMDDLADLEDLRRKTITLPVTLSLHGVEKELTADVAVTLLSDDLVSVSSTTPISIATAAFGLSDGVAKLESAAEVKIIPSATVSFDFVFKRKENEPLKEFPALEPSEPEPAPLAPASDQALASTEQTPTPQNSVAADQPSAPLPVEDLLTKAECNLQFRVLRQMGQLTLTGEDAQIGPSTLQLIADAAEIIRYCPIKLIEIGVHTTAKAGSDENMALSNNLAVDIRDRLISLGVPSDRLLPVGYGETKPRVPKAVAGSNRYNQRIELLAVNP